MSHTPKSISLEKLAAHAEQYALNCLNQDTEVPASFFILAADGSLLIVRAKTTDVRRKNESKLVARLLCIAHAATAVVFFAEAWMSADPDSTTPPSQSPDRQEVLILSTESFERSEQRVLPIIRDRLMKFSGFGKAKITANAEGRFTNILPDKPASPELQADAHRLLSELTRALNTSHSGSPLTLFDLYKE